MPMHWKNTNPVDIPSAEHQAPLFNSFDRSNRWGVGSKLFTVVKMNSWYHRDHGDIEFGLAVNDFSNLCATQGAGVIYIITIDNSMICSCNDNLCSSLKTHTARSTQLFTSKCRAPRIETVHEAYVRLQPSNVFLKVVGGILTWSYNIPRVYDSGSCPVGHTPQRPPSA